MNARQFKKHWKQHGSARGKSLKKWARLVAAGDVEVLMVGRSDAQAWLDRKAA